MANTSKSSSIRWPDGKSFAFTVFDDTDNDDPAKTRPVYELLASCSMKTTKSCWVRQPGPEETGNCPGKTTEEPEYLDYLLELEAKGYEIGLHNVSWASSTREQIKEGLDRFAQQFGHPPKVFANHTGTRDSIYWGPARLGGVRRLLYNLLTRFRNKNRFTGHVESSPYFWGDLCRDRIDYVRNFTYTEIDTLAKCPEMPYHDPRRSYVKNWFASCDGHDLPTFVRAISEENQQRLEKAGGCCIMYTHFAEGFARDGHVDSRFETLIRKLSQRNGWFVPVGRLLDYLVDQKGRQVIRARRLARMEWSWLWQKIKMGGTS